jgi:hypothetical protein
MFNKRESENMETITNPSTPAPQQDRKQRTARAQWITELNGLSQFPPLELVTKPNLTTAEAGWYLDRRPQTLRAWSCLENGPIRPKKIHGLLAWSTAEVKALAGVPA